MEDMLLKKGVLGVFGDPQVTRVGGALVVLQGAQHADSEL